MRSLNKVEPKEGEPKSLQFIGTLEPISNSPAIYTCIICESNQGKAYFTDPTNTPRCVHICDDCMNSPGGSMSIKSMIRLFTTIMRGQ